MNAKKIVIAGCGVAAVVGVGIVIFKLKKKKEVEYKWMQEESLEDLEEIIREQEYYSERVLENGLEETYCTIETSDDKPDLDSYFEKIEFEPEETSEKEEKIEQEEINHLQVRERNIYNTYKMIFDPNGLPMFNSVEWDSENGNIDFITQEIYRGDEYPNYDRHVLSWFHDDNVLTDEYMVPVDVVDTIGPSVFTKLMREPDSTFWCKNDELETCYEVFVCNNEFEDALIDFYGTDIVDFDSKETSEID